MPKPIASALPPLMQQHFLEGIQFALEELSRNVVARITQMVHDQIANSRGSAAKSKQALTDAVAEQLPEILEQEFLTRLLSNETSARQHRAVLAHLLSAAEVQASVGAGFAPWPWPTGSASSAPNSSEEITSEAASKLLHVSRTHLNALADAGVLGPVRRTEGGHRRLVKAEVMRYLKEAQDRQLKGVQDMMSASDELGLYEDEAKALRPKRLRRP